MDFTRLAQATPVDGLFKGPPKTYLVAGQAGISLDAIRTMRDRLNADIGQEEITFNEVKDATHCFMIMGWHEPERTGTLKQLDWIHCNPVR